MDFEEFRRKREKEKQQKADADRRAREPAANGKNLDWVDGMGPAGPRNPKVKGFVLGRFRRRRIDPRTLERPEGYEKTSLGNGIQQKRSQADAEIERRRAALERAQRELAEAEQAQREAEIAKRKERDGISRIRGIKKY